MAVAPLPTPVAPRARPEPTTPEEQFDRGLEHLRAGKWFEAADWFGKARQPGSDPRYTAYLAYCRSKTANQPMATTLYREAVEDRGFGDAWARNNWAYQLIHTSPTTPNLRRAITECTAALDREPTARAARLNRAWATFMLYWKEKGPAKGLRPVNPGCLADIEAVLATGPRTADVYYKAAVIVATFGGDQPDQMSRTFDYLRLAVERGRPAAALANDPPLRHLVARPELQQLLRLPPTAPAAEANIGLMDPPLR
jgi:tetratricopeptide (TPR) repeat protein